MAFRIPFGAGRSRYKVGGTSVMKPGMGWSTARWVSPPIWIFAVGATQDLEESSDLSTENYERLGKRDLCGRDQ